jgi:hypothetical protein
MRIERRSFAPPAPTEDEIAREAFQRALEDGQYSEKSGSPSKLRVADGANC